MSGNLQNINRLYTCSIDNIEHECDKKIFNKADNYNVLFLLKFVLGSRPQSIHTPAMSYQSKYGELLNVIEDLGREIKPTYAGSKMAQERLKKGVYNYYNYYIYIAVTLVVEWW